ncbi:MAG TPA: ABC transporter permease subunit [Haliangiales bacterium]|nr:ABC transporter permease subunit [Haliangiales bacterium]
MRRSTALREMRAAARLDLAEVARSRWLLFCAGTYALVAGIFVLVGLRESTLLGFTGMGRVLLSFCHALVLLLPLLALTATSAVVNRARDEGTFELLFTQPLRRGAWFAAVSGVRLLALVAPLVLLMIGMGAVAGTVWRSEVPWPFLWRSVAVCAALLVCFAGIGTAISTFIRNPARATTYVILVWAASVALLDFGLIGLMLRWQLDPQATFTLAALNPVQDARMALLSSLEPDLATFGPVGFYLANRVGGDALFALGVAWPAAVGVGAWGAALRRFRRGDLV